MELQVQVEKPSNIVRKLTVKVPSKVVDSHIQKGLAQVQRTASLKGFRKGHAPLSVIKQFYGEDVRHEVYHNLIDESLQEAVREQQLMTVGRPTIEAAEHKTGAGEHDHTIQEGQDLVYTATVEVIPELEVKSYTGLALTREKVEVGAADVEKVVEGLRDSHAELVPVAADAEGKSPARTAKKGDFVDLTFNGGLVTESGIEEKEGMKGNRVLEIGSNTLIPGFEDQIVGLKAGETKTFRIQFPAEYHDKDIQGKEAEFTITVQELKEKKLPVLDDEFSKQMGYESLADLKKKAEEHLTREKTNEAESKLRGELVKKLIEKHEFEVPKALIDAQVRSLVQEWAEHLKQQGASEQIIQQTVIQELENLKKRADSQVRASLLLEAIAKKEDLSVKDEEIDAEMSKNAASMRVDVEKLREFYAKNPGRKEDLVFRLRQDKTLEFLVAKAKIKSS